MVDVRLSSDTGLRLPTVVALVLTALLAISFGVIAAIPQTAHASGNTKVLVLTKAKEKGELSDLIEEAKTYKYNKKGLIKAVKTSGSYWDSEPNSYKYVKTYSYDKKYRLKSCSEKDVSGGSSSPTKVTYRLNKKGYVVKGSNAAKYTYNSKGRLIRLNDNGSTMKFSYNKKGRLTSYARGSDGEWGNAQKLKYDKKGRIVSPSDAEKATYKSGRLKTVALAYYPGEINSVKTFTFKKITVPKKYAKMIKAQQAALIWGILPVEAAHR